MTICSGCTLHDDGECQASELARAFWQPDDAQCAMREEAHEPVAESGAQLSIPGL